MESILWQPTQKYIETTNLHRFIKYVTEQKNLKFADYKQLYQWSIDNRADFWEMVSEFTGIIYQQPHNKILEEDENGHMRNAKWFVGSKLNFAENLLRRQDDSESIIFYNEANQRTSYSFKQLYNAVSQCAQALQGLGVSKGDKVAGFLPNIPQTIIAMLATTSLGAVWSSCSPDFGADGVLDRFGQIEPKVLITVDGYTFKGKAIDISNTVNQLTAEINSINQVIIIPFLYSTIDTSKYSKATLWQNTIEQYSAKLIDFIPVNFNDPLYILFSSGTTGKPKCIVHSVGGTLIQHLKELMLHTNLKSNDRMFYYTTCGWMMWNWFVSSLAVGASVVLYDGNPCYPKDDRLFDILSDESVTAFGTSAKYLASLAKQNLKPKSTHNLKSLKTILSTGSPLMAETFDYVYQNIKLDINLASISGGTDIISCFVLGNPILPVKRGEIQCRGLGMAVEFFNENGNSVVGKKGELVCTKAFPSMPLYFYNDKNDKKYMKAYFSRFENIWAHGDYGELTIEDGIVIYGRSDAVLNPGGVRIGTAEIYRQVEKVDEVLESIAIGQDWFDDTRIILFVVLRENQQLTEELIDKIKQTIKSNSTPRHVPAKIIQVPELPRTVSGKIVELAVRDIVHGKPVVNQDAIANPEALNYFKGIPELETS